jgi:ribonuclease HI
MLTLHFDGSCFPTGTEAHGAFIVKDGDTVLHESNFLEAKEGTNNIAEWGGLVAGIRWLKANIAVALNDETISQDLKKFLENIK